MQPSTNASWTVELVTFALLTTPLVSMLQSTVTPPSERRILLRLDLVASLERAPVSDDDAADLLRVEATAIGGRDCVCLLEQRGIHGLRAAGKGCLLDIFHVSVQRVCERRGPGRRRLRRTRTRRVYGRFAWRSRLGYLKERAFRDEIERPREIREQPEA